MTTDVEAIDTAENGSVAKPWNGQEPMMTSRDCSTTSWTLRNSVSMVLVPVSLPKL